MENRSGTTEKLNSLHWFSNPEDNPIAVIDRQGFANTADYVRAKASSIQNSAHQGQPPDSGDGSNILSRIDTKGYFIHHTPQLDSQYS